MRSSLKLLALCGVLTFTLATIPGMAPAQDAAAVAKQRQDAMRQQFRDLKAIKDFSEGKGDQPAATAAAAELTRLVPKIPDLFPPGTGMAPPEGPFRAKPEVWTQWDKFLAANKTVVASVSVLDTAVKSGDKQQIATALTTLNVCSACHDDFRTKIQQ
jgi:cytochrome c556